MKTLSLIGQPKRRALKHATQNTQKRESGRDVDLNFKVSAEFRRDFKLYAAAHDMKQKEVLLAAFSALKEKSLSRD